MDDAGTDLDRLLDVVPAAVVVIGRDDTITRWNAAAEVLYGHEAGSVVGRPALDVLLAPEDHEAGAALLERVRREGTWEGDRRVVRRDGQVLVSSFRVADAGDGSVAWVATDGMDQGLAEQERAVLLSAEHAARRSSEEALGLVEAILSSAPVGVAVFDLDLRYVRVNDAYAEISGIEAAVHIGNRVGDLVPLPYEVRADLRRVVTTGRRILDRTVELPDRLAPDRLRHFRVSYFPVRTTADVLVGAGATVVEVTEAKRAEAERVALLERAEAAQKRLAILATASTVLASTMQIDDLLDRLARVLVPGVADWCVIEALGSAGAIDHVAVSHRDRAAAEELGAFLRANPIDERASGPIAAVMAGGEGRLFTADLAAAALGEAAVARGRPELAGDFDVQSSLIVPIEARGRVLGVLVLSTERGRTLDEDDLDLAVEVAHRAALALGNARAFQQEHQIAESLQRSLLPATVEDVDGLDLAVRYLAATDGASVGGDWYDVICFEDGTVGIVVGDVVGHDLAASSAMGQLRSTLRAFAYEDHASPARSLARLDRLFEALGLSYATCVLGIVDAASGAFRWSSAGHPPPLLVRGRSARLLDGGGGALLGVAAGTESGVGEAVLEDGDFLVLYTDGLVERRRESISDGLDRLVQVASAADATSAEGLCSALLSGLLPRGTARDDDVAILVARLRRARAGTVHELALDAGAGAGAGAVRAARQFVAGILEGDEWAEAREVAQLLVSELATNAIRYGAPPITLSVTIDGRCVEVAVRDEEPSAPRATAAVDELVESGRGLRLVASLAANWGTRSHPTGKTVWFTLER